MNPFSPYANVIPLGLSVPPAAYLPTQAMPYGNASFLAPTQLGSQLGQTSLAGPVGSTQLGNQLCMPQPSIRSGWTPLVPISLPGHPYWPGIPPPSAPSVSVAGLPPSTVSTAVAQVPQVPPVSTQSRSTAHTDSPATLGQLGTSTSSTVGSEAQTSSNLAIASIATALAAQVSTLRPGASHAVCDVTRFKRSEKVTIDCWLYQMEHFLQTAGRDTSNEKAAWKKEMLVRMQPEHFEEVKQFMELPYADFVAKLKTAFAKPNLAQSYLAELGSIAQKDDELVETFMLRTREVVDRAFPTLLSAERERYSVMYFAKGLRDPLASQLVSGSKDQSSGEALRIASSTISNARLREGASARNKPSQNARGRYFGVEGTSQQSEEAPEPQQDSESADQSEQTSGQESDCLVTAGSATRSKTDTPARRQQRAFPKTAPAAPAPPFRPGTVTWTRFCRFCRIGGHTIYECRKARTLLDELESREAANSGSTGAKSGTARSSSASAFHLLGIEEGSDFLVIETPAVPSTPDLDQLPQSAGQV